MLARRNWVKREPQSRPEATTSGVASNDRKAVSLAFFSDRREVVRLSSARRFDEEYLECRSDFARYVPSANILAVSDDRAALREEYVLGELLSTTYSNNDILLNASRRIFSGLISMARSYNGPECTEKFAKLVASVGPFEGLRCAIDDVTELLCPTRCVPSHGDLHGHNIIVRARTLEPTAIDFDSIRLRPPWFDAVRFIQYEVGRPIRKGRRLNPAVFSALDDGLAELVSLATGRPALPTEWRCLVALGYLAWRRSDRIGVGDRGQKVERDSRDLQAWISAAETG